MSVPHVCSGADLKVINDSAIVRDVAFYTPDILDNVSLDVLSSVGVLQRVDAMVVLVCRCCHCCDHHCPRVARESVLQTSILQSVSCTGNTEFADSAPLKCCSVYGADAYFLCTRFSVGETVPLDTCAAAPVPL